MMALALLMALPLLVLGACPNMCNKQGICWSDNTCVCFDEYTGADCSQIYCPTGAAWVGYASATDTVHTDVECSNMGICDRSTGTCTCNSGFTGAACEKFACPNNCNNQGRCMSMSEVAVFQDNINYLYSNTYTTYWDADKIYGCVCDKGYTGYDCSLNICPSGHDPYIAGVDSVQVLSCRCDATCSGSFTLTFEDETTLPIPYGSTATVLAAYINGLTTVGVVAASILTGGSAICTSGSATTTAITFTTLHGTIPAFTYVSSLASTSANTPTLSISYDGTSSSVVGTKLNLPCNRRGTCTPSTGVCTCYSGYFSSDGEGNSGTLNDCGYQKTTPTTCPNSCSGNGVCGSNFVCSCYTGYTGYDCSLLSCPTGIAWWDEPTATDTAHAYATCSNKGVCNTLTGLCTCQTGWEGNACQRLSCPSSCSGHGRCYSLTQLGLLGYNDATAYTYGSIPNNPATWDANKIYGCSCDTARELYVSGVGNTAGFQGYDCSQYTCPKGDDPFNIFSAYMQIQTVTCTATAGTFTLSFRGYTTGAIAFSATAATVVAALESISTIGTVTVTMATVGTGVTSTAACSATGVAMKVSFMSDFGTLPLLVAVGSGGPVLSVVISQASQKGSYECSNRGTCNRATGLCTCFKGMTSSDGWSGIGLKNDCGFPSIFA